MESSAVEEGFSFLDLEDCDEKDQQYLKTIIQPFGGDRISTNAKTNKPSETSEHILDTASRNSSKNSENSKVPITTGTQPNIIASEAVEKRVYSDGVGRERTVATNKQTLVASSEKETIVATQISTQVNLALSSRAQTRNQQHPPYQSPQHAKIRPIPQSLASPGITPYLADAQQVSQTLHFKFISI